MEAPICQIPGCKNKALVGAYNKMICGECLMKLKAKINSDINNKMNEISEDFELGNSASCNVEGGTCESCQ